jgi:hypothetical protein
MQIDQMDFLFSSPDLSLALKVSIVKSHAMIFTEPRQITRIKAKQTYFDQAGSHLDRLQNGNLFTFDDNRIVSNLCALVDVTFPSIKKITQDRQSFPYRRRLQALTRQRSER